MPIITVHLYSGAAITLREGSPITATLGPQIAEVSTNRRAGDGGAWVFLDTVDSGLVLVDPAAIERMTIGGNPAAVGFTLPH